MFVIYMSYRVIAIFWKGELRWNLWPLFFFLRRTLFSKKNLAKVASAQSTRVEAKRTGKDLWSR